MGDTDAISFPGNGPDIGALLAAERARLLELLSTVGGAEWRRPSPCPEWDVLGLCCHLLGDDFSLLSRHRDGHHGTPSPSMLTESEFIQWLDNLQVEWVHASRRMSPRVVVDLLGFTGLELADVFTGVDPLARSAHVSWAGPDLVPMWLDQLRELSEYWIHRQQLRQALGHPTDLRADLLGPVLDGLRWAYPYQLSKVPARPGDTITITVYGEVSATWHVVADGAGWQFRSQSGTRFVGSLSMTTDQAWRLLSNNLSVDDLANLVVTGDAAIVEALLRTRAIIGTPQ